MQRHTQVKSALEAKAEACCKPVSGIEVIRMKTISKKLNVFTQM
jgi:hypothetical protein